MRKLVLFTLFLISYTNMCLASLSMPKDDRWFFVDLSEKPHKMDMWIDYNSLQLLSRLLIAPSQCLQSLEQCA